MIMIPVIQETEHILETLILGEEEGGKKNKKRRGGFFLGERRLSILE